jgi:hypothetical protein
MPSTFKKMMPEYKMLEGQLMKVIAQKFGFRIPLPEEVKELDRIYLDLEWNCLVMKTNTYLEYWPAERAEEEFLNIYKTL